MAAILWHYCYPFTEPRRCVGLSFAFDPELVDLLKHLNRELRDEIQAPGVRRQATGWLSDRRIWFVDGALWYRVEGYLRSYGHTVTEDASRHERQAEEPPPRSAPPSFDPYAVLGIPQTAEWETVRRAYLTAIKVLHPDVNPAAADAEVGALLTRRSAELNRAFHELEQRKQRGAFR